MPRRGKTNDVDPFRLILLFKSFRIDNIGKYRAFVEKTLGSFTKQKTGGIMQNMQHILSATYGLLELSEVSKIKIMVKMSFKFRPCFFC